MCTVNVQHDCIKSSCKDVQHRRMRQERDETEQTYDSVLHVASPHYIINAYSLHNYQEILSFLPPSLQKPTDRGLDSSQIQKAAAQHIRQKKTTADGDGEAEPEQTTAVSASSNTAVFEHSTAGRKAPRKRGKQRAPATKNARSQDQSVNTVHAISESMTPALPTPPTAHHNTPHFHPV